MIDTPSVPFSTIVNYKIIENTLQIVEDILA